MQRRLSAIAIAFVLLLFPAAADTYSLSAYISGVSGGVDNIGFGLFPIGTTFGFERLFPLVPGQRDAEFQFEMSFAFNNTDIDERFDYMTGKPVWMDSGISSLSGTYFNPRASIDVYLDQGFGDNPLYADGSLVNLRLGFNARYSMALERVDLSKAGNDDPPLFVDDSGNLKDPFDGALPAYPWLEGSRQVYTDYLYFNAYLNLDRDTPTDAEAEHGLGMDLTFEYGPEWLFNSFSSSGAQSDFWRIGMYLEEKMELFTVYQDNGWNWVNMYIGHSNTIRYTGGDIVPANMLPDDRLRALVSDRIWLHFTAPQFLAGDCFAFIELNLYNTLMFGSVANEAKPSSFSIELQSSFSARIQVRLFGFIRLEYQVGYDFIRGIWPEYPRWWQNAALSFYVSV